jgi:hypothetical protein
MAKSSAFCDITPYSLFKVNRRFGLSCRLQLHSRRKQEISMKQPASRAYYSETSADFQRTTRRYIPEDKTLHNHHCAVWSVNGCLEGSGPRLSYGTRTDIWARDRPNTKQKYHHSTGMFGKPVTSPFILSHRQINVISKNHLYRLTFMGNAANIHNCLIVVGTTDQNS